MSQVLTFVLDSLIFDKIYSKDELTAVKKSHSRNNHAGSFYYSLKK